MRSVLKYNALVLLAGLGLLATTIHAQAQQTTYEIAVWIDQTKAPGFVEIGGLTSGAIVSFEVTAPGADTETTNALVGSDGAARVFGADLETPLIAGTYIVARDQSNNVLGEYTVEALTVDWDPSTGVLSGTADPGSTLAVATWPLGESAFLADSQGTWSGKLDPALAAALGTIEVFLDGDGGLTIVAISSEPPLPTATINGVAPVGVSLWVVTSEVPVGSVFKGFVEAGGDLDLGGCTLATTIGGSWVIFVPGAPLFVNQAWFDAYLDGVPAGKAFLSLCP